MTLAADSYICDQNKNCGRLKSGTTSQGTGTFTHDHNGNMQSMTNTCGTTSYTWDARNRLTGITGYKPDCSSLTATFSYDALGRRTAKTINGRTIGYLYDGADIVQETEGGVVIVNYPRTLNIDEPLARIASDGTVRYYHTDAQGSIISLTDETGTARTTYIYEPFGAVTITGQQSDNPFQYTGRENDGTGSYYYRARYYNPELQRFISEDPIRLSGGVNFYSYVGNSPTNLTDPYGLAWRFPDYISGNVNIAVANPWTGTLIGWSGTASLDRYGNWYWSPLGIGFGKSLTVVSGSLTANWMNQDCKPSKTQLKNFLSGHGLNGAIGFWSGATESWSPGNGTATGFGLVTPQVGASYNYSFQGPGNIGRKW